MFIYVIVNSITGKIYIGQHKGDNLRKYLQTKLSQAHYELKRKGHGGGSYLFASMRKHDPSVWSIHPLISGIQTREELDAHEKLLIKALGVQHKEIGYNICRGGEGFTGTFSVESRAKMSAAHKRIWDDPELRKNHDKAAMKRVGIPRPPQVGEAVRRMRTGAKASAQTKEKIRAARLIQPEPRLGTPTSDESRKRMSESHKGLPSNMRGKHHTEESKNKNRRAHLIDLHGKIFGNVVVVSLVCSIQRSPAGSPSASKWVVRCAVCGDEGTVRSDRIRNGDSAFMGAHRH